MEQERLQCLQLTLNGTHLLILKLKILGFPRLDHEEKTLPDHTQHSQQADIHDPGGIRTCNPSKREAAEARLRPRGHWDRLLLVQEPLICS